MKIKSILLLITILIAQTASCFGQIRELDIYDEWFSFENKFKADRPFFIIRDADTLARFWPQTGFPKIAPSLDFSKYMIFVWSPGKSRKDLSNVKIDRLIYKNGALLVLLDMDIKNKYLYASKNQIKAAIFPIFEKGDIFIQQKIVKNKYETEWQPLYAIWDMNGERKTPFEFVLMDKAIKEKIVLDNTIVANQQPQEEFIERNETESEESVAQKHEVRPVNVRPVNVTPVIVTPTVTHANNANVLKPQAGNVISDIEKAKKAVVSQSAITIGNTPTPKVDPDVKPQIAPGMAEDPLFGSEFDITF